MIATCYSQAIPYICYKKGLIKYQASCSIYFIVRSIFYFNIPERRFGTEFDADRIAPAKIAFDNLIKSGVNQRTAKRAGGNTGLASDTSFVININCPGFFISTQSIEHTGPDAGGIVALEADHRHILIFGVSQRVNPTPARFAVSGEFKGTRQFTGSATGAKFRDYLIAVFHIVASLALTTSEPIFSAVSCRLQSSQISK